MRLNADIGEVSPTLPIRPIRPHDERKPRPRPEPEPERQPRGDQPPSEPDGAEHIDEYAAEDPTCKH